MTIEFNDHEASCVKSIAVKQQSQVKATTRFMSGKLLMFAKLSLNSFIYSLVETLTYLTETVRQIYQKYQIEKILCYHILTDTDSTALQFAIISDPSSTYPECDVRDILFEIFVKTEIYDRFDTSHPFWQKFDAQKPERQKVLGLYEVEHIDNPCYVTLAINPKEYFEYFQSTKLNKKHKGIKKGSKGMDYENYAARIAPLKDFETYEKPKNNYKEVVRFAVKKGYMVTTKISKTKFSQLKDKRFYFPDGILYIPFGHRSLKELSKYKYGKGQKIEKYFWLEKEKLLTMEKTVLEKTPRLKFLNDVLNQQPKVVDLNQVSDFQFLYLEETKTSILDFVLSAEWMKWNTATMENLRETSS